jgi:zinc transporter 1/2/3
MDDNNITTTLAPPPTRNALKAVLILLLFFCTFLASTAAFLLKRAALHSHRSTLTVVFSLVSCFGGGVFLATCLLDLLPDSIDCIEKAKFYKADFPVIELGVGVGFLLVLFIEQSIVHAHEQGWFGYHEGQRHLLGHHDEHNEGEEEETAANDNVSESSQIVDAQFGQPHSTVRVVLLVMALSLHAVFEGLSLGMIPEVTALFQIFGALLIHKTVIGFSLGIRLVQSKLHTFPILLCCAIFAGQVVIGGFGGLIIIDILDKQSRGMARFVSGLLQAVACGTFLYITCFEILPHELSRKGHRPLKLLFILIGFALISTFIAIFPDPPSPDD